MKSRGRKSAEAQALALVAQPVEQIQRPDAGYDLTDEAAREWWKIVNRMPADWFPAETHAALTQLCRLITRCRRLAQLTEQMEKSEDFDAAEYRNLVSAEGEASRVVLSLMTKLRLTHQSRFDQSKSVPVKMARPWDD
jgi:hypothetical protein